MGDLAAHVVSLVPHTATRSTAAVANPHRQVPAAVAAATAATTAATAAALSSVSQAAAFPELSRVAAVAEVPSEAARANLLQLVTAAAVKALDSSGQDAESPPLQEPLMEAGLNSAAAVQLVALLEAATGLELPGTLVFDYPTIAEITDHLLSSQPESEASPSQGNTTPPLQGNLAPSRAAAVDGSTPAAAAAAAATAAAAAAVGQTDILTVVFAAVTDVLGLTRAEAEELSFESPLMDAGLNSASAIQLTGALEEALDADLPGTLIFDYPTVASLVSHLATCNIKLPTGNAAVPRAPLSTASAVTTSHASAAAAAAAAVDNLAGQAAHTAQVPKSVLSAMTNCPSKAIAIVSSAHRVPGGVLQLQASTPPADRVTPVPLDRWDSNQPPLDSTSELNAAFGAFIQGADEFDSVAFRLSAAEATLIDPQQRLLLETFAEAQSAFTHWDSPSDQNAGQHASSSSSSSLKQRFGVYVGVSQLEYARITYETGSNLNAYYATGGHLSVTSGRIAYTFGLKGPAMAGVPFIKPPVAPWPVPV